MKTVLTYFMILFVVFGLCYVQCVKAEEDAICSHEYEGLICPDVFMTKQPENVVVIGHKNGVPVVEVLIKVDGYPFDEVLALVYVYGDVVRLVAYQYNLGKTNYMFVLKDGKFVQARPPKNGI